jgi:hypothetical protein
VSCMSCSGGLITRQPIQAALRAPIADSRHSQRPAQRQLTAGDAVTTAIVHRPAQRTFMFAAPAGTWRGLISQRLQPRNQHDPSHIRIAALSLRTALACM